MFDQFLIYLGFEIILPFYKRFNYEVAPITLGPWKYEHAVSLI